MWQNTSSSALQLLVHYFSGNRDIYCYVNYATTENLLRGTHTHTYVHTCVYIQYRNLISYIEMYLYRSHLHVMNPGEEHLFGPQSSAMKVPQLLPLNLRNRLSLPTSSRSFCISPLFTPALLCHPNYLHREVEASHSQVRLILTR